MDYLSIILPLYGILSDLVLEPLTEDANAVGDEATADLDEAWPPPLTGPMCGCLDGYGEVAGEIGPTDKRVIVLRQREESMRSETDVLGFHGCSFLSSGGIQLETATRLEVDRVVDRSIHH